VKQPVGVNDMTINQLRYFVSIAGTQSFTKAAKSNFITQPAISRQMRELEQQLNVKLFLRDTHNVSLTMEGQNFLNYAIDVLEQTHKMETRIQAISRGNIGTIRISAFSSLASVLSECLAMFTKRYPNVQIFLDMLTDKDQMAAINSQAYEFYFTRQDMVKRNDSLEYMNIFADKLCLVINMDDHTQIDANDFSTLSDKPMALINPLASPALFEDVITICRNRNYTPKIINYCNRTETMITLVSAGIATSIMPASLVKYNPVQNIIVIPISGTDTDIPLVVAWEKKSANPIMEKFLLILREQYENH